MDFHGEALPLVNPLWQAKQATRERSRPKELSPTEDENKSLQGRWVNSHELHVGDIVMCADGEVRKIEKVEHWTVDSKPVSNLTVEYLHTFAVGDDSILVHNIAWCDYLRRHAGDPPHELLQKQSALRAAGETNTIIHAHHIVIKKVGNTAMAPYIREAQAILGKHDIDVLYSYDNLTWAIKWDHSVDYAEAVAKALRDADAIGGKPKVLDTLRRIADILNEGKKFWGF